MSVFKQKVNLMTALAIGAVVGAGGYAAGLASAPPAPRATTATREPLGREPGAVDRPEALDGPEPGEPGAAETALPPSHPDVGSMAVNASGGAGTSGGAGDDVTLGWKAPPRWKTAPNPNAMRIATYRVPAAAGDTEEGDLSITRVGGSVEANATRWIGQFDPEGQKTATRRTKKVGPLAITIVEAEGAYANAMGNDPRPAAGRALLGAIVETGGTPYFFKLTGPAKTVRAARAEFDALLEGLAPRS